MYCWQVFECCTSHPGFLNLVTIGIWGWIILCHAGYPVQGRGFSNNPDLHLLDSSSTISSPAHPLPVMTNKNVCRHCQVFPGERGKITWDFEILWVTESLCCSPISHEPCGIPCTTLHCVIIFRIMYVLSQQNCYTSEMSVSMWVLMLMLFMVGCWIPFTALSSKCKFQN